MKSEKMLQPSPCLEQAEMEAYIRGGLDAKSERKVEMHIADCPICSDMIEGMEAYGVDEFQPAVDGLKQRDVPEADEENDDDQAGGVEYYLNPDAAPKRRWNRGNVFFFSVAATVALFVAFRMFWVDDRKSMGEIAMEYTDWERPSVWRGDSEAKDSLEMGKEAVASEEFARAVQLLENNNSAEGKYWLGQAWMRLDKPEEALYAFQISSEGEGRFAQLSKFHQGLTSMMLGDVEPARKIFKEISADSSHPKQKQASEILAKMTP